MNLNNLTVEENKILAKGKLLAYSDDVMTSEPPCQAECTFELFNSFKQTGYNRRSETPLERLHNDFPNIDENELMVLTAYFKQADDYCKNVCCAYAMIYPYPVGSGKTKEEIEDIRLVVKACRQRYPWLTEEYIEMYLKGIVAMCIR